MRINGYQLSGYSTTSLVRTLVPAMMVSFTLAAPWTYGCLISQVIDVPRFSIRYQKSVVFEPYQQFIIRLPESWTSLHGRPLSRGITLTSAYLLRPSIITSLPFCDFFFNLYPIVNPLKNIPIFVVVSTSPAYSYSSSSQTIEEIITPTSMSLNLRMIFRIYPKSSISSVNS